jgi:beta-glucosidase
MIDASQSHALKTRLAIPLLYGVDAVHGHNNVIGAVIFPHNIGLGCTRNAKLVEQAARITAEEVRATGAQFAFAPCVAAPQDIRWGRTYEGFSESPEIVKELGAAAVRGLQGDDLRSPLSLLASAKHYVADGGTTAGTGLAFGGNRVRLDQGDARIDEATLRRIHLPGYVAAIEAGVGSIMPSYSSWNGVKCSASRRLLTEILKEELGFEGFVISDSNALEALPGDRKKKIETSINAGMDMIMVSGAYVDYFTRLKELAEEGAIPRARIDDAVRRILRVKFAMGLMDKSRSQLADRRLWKNFGSAERRKVVRQSLALLKNDNAALPIARRAARILVAGKNADDMGAQCGGWTVAWQGQRGQVTAGGATILQALRQGVSKSTKVDYSLDGSGARGADAGVAVVGESPYAEGRGDEPNLRLSQEDVTAIRTLRAGGAKKVVVVVVSGRPLILDQVLDQADAIVAAWLPGTEGQGVADVLLGEYKPTGKLSFSWPRSSAQAPINMHSAEYDPLYKVGYGLTY